MLIVRSWLGGAPREYPLSLSLLDETAKILARAESYPIHEAICTVVRKLGAAPGISKRGRLNGFLDDGIRRITAGDVIVALTAVSLVRPRRPDRAGFLRPPEEADVAAMTLFLLDAIEDGRM